MVLLIAVVPECTVARLVLLVLVRVRFENVPGSNEYVAPSSMMTNPPFSTIFVAVPPA